MPGMDFHQTLGIALGLYPLAHENGYEIIALETGEDIPSINDVTWPAKGLILLGNEELGISPELMAEATMKVTIPMAGRKASMNVAGAFAIMAFKIRSEYKQ